MPLAEASPRLLRLPAARAGPAAMPCRGSSGPGRRRPARAPVHPSPASPAKPEAPWDDRAGVLAEPPLEQRGIQSPGRRWSREVSRCGVEFARRGIRRPFRLALGADHEGGSRRTVSVQGVVSPPAAADSLPSSRKGRWCRESAVGAMHAVAEAASQCCGKRCALAPWRPPTFLTFAAQKEAELNVAVQRSDRRLKTVRQMQ